MLIVENGEIVFEMFEKNGWFDLLIIDVVMLMMDGLMMVCYVCVKYFDLLIVFMFGYVEG